MAKPESWDPRSRAVQTAAWRIKTKSMFCLLKTKIFPFSHPTSTHLKFCFGLTQLSVSLLFLLNKMLCHFWCLTIWKWKSTYFTWERAGKDVSSHLNSSPIYFSELIYLMNTAQVGKCFLSATGHFRCQINSSHELICQVCLGILTCLLLLPCQLIAAMWMCPDFQWRGNRFLISPQLKVKPMHFIFLGTGLERKRKIWNPPGTSRFHSVPARTWIPQSVAHQATLILNTRWQMRSPGSAGLFL